MNNINFRLSIKEELASRVKESTSDLSEEELKDDPELSEDEIKDKASKLSPKQVAETLQQVKELLEDEDEEVSDEERKVLTDAFVAAVDMLNKKIQASGESEEFHLIGKHDQSTHSRGQNVGRRLKSLTPGAIIRNKRTDRSSATAEYVAGKYQFDYTPKNKYEAKHKYTKTRTSTKRWFAAAVLTSIPSLIIPGKNKAFGIYKKRTAQRKKAKSQYFKFKYAERAGE